MTDRDPIDEALRPVLELPEATWSSAVAELCSRHPAHAAEIRRRFGVLCEFGLHEPLASSAREIAAPERLGEFHLLERLGQGGMGIVHVARQARLDRLVALKLVRPEQLYFEGARERFRREIAAVARLSHPGIVSVFAVGEEQGIPYLAMELLRGASLEDVLSALAGRRSEDLSGADLANVVRTRAGAAVDTALREAFTGSWTTVCTEITRHLAQAIAHAHEQGIVHRDVKPSNVMVTVEGRVVLLDFGLAQPAGTDRMTRAGGHVGSLPYMAPEQLRGEGGDARTDVYALGVLLRELLTLRQPFLAASQAATRERVLQGEGRALAADNKAVSWELATVCAKATEPDARRRYASAAEFAQDLENVLSRRPIAARPASALRRVVRWAQRRPTLATSLVLGACLAVGTPTAIAVGIAGQRDRARAAETLQEQKSFEANLAAAWAALQLHDVGEARRRLEACSEASRGFEWQHLALAVDGSLAVLRGHADSVGAIAMTRDSRRLASGDDQGRVRLWDLARGVVTHEFTHHRAGIDQLAFRADGSHLLVHDREGHTSLVDVAARTVRAERHGVNRRESVWLGTDGRSLLANLGGWRFVELDPDALTARRTIVLEAVGSAPESVLVHDGRHLASVSGYRLDVWDLQSGRSCLRLPDATHVGFSALNLSDAGDRVVLAEPNGRILVTEIPSGRLVQVLGASFAVRDVAFDPTGRYLVAGGRDGAVRCWEIVTGRLLGIHSGHDGPIRCVASAGSRVLIATGGADRHVRLWSPFGSRAHFELRAHVGAVTNVAFLAGGDLLVTASEDGSVRICDAIHGMPHFSRLDYPHHVNALAIGAGTPTIFAAYHGSLTTVDPAASPQPPGVPLGSGWILDLATARDRVLIAGQDGCQIAPRDDPASSRTLLGPLGAFTRCALGRAARLAYATHASGAIVRWDLDAEGPGRVLATESGAIADLALDAAERTLLLVVGHDLVLRDAHDGHVVWRRASSSRPLSVVALPGSRRIVTGHTDGSVVFWDATRGEPLLTRRLGDSPVRALACDERGRAIAAGCQDGTCQVLRGSSAALANDVLRSAGILAARSLHADLRADSRAGLHTRVDVLAAIDARLDLDPEVREWMRENERWSLPLPWCTLSAAAEMAAQPDLPAERYLAVRKVAEAYLAQVSPKSRFATGILALASMRLSDPERALAWAATLTDTELSGEDWPEAALRAGRALARRARGDDAGARADLAQLARLAELHDAPGSIVSLWREVETALSR